VVSRYLALLTVPAFQNEKLLIGIASQLGEKITSDLKSEVKVTLRSTLDDALQANRWVTDWVRVGLLAG
jgi:hypothetical protein